MKLFRSAVRTEDSATVEFHSRTPDNLLRVESTREGGTVIRAAKNNFNPALRRTFVRYLKVEGFVPATGGTSWVYDPCWPYAATRFNPYTRRLCRRLLLGPALAWLLFMWLVAFH